MTLLRAESWDHFTSQAMIAEKHSTVVGSAQSIAAAAGRNGTSALLLSNCNSWVTEAVNNLATVIIGVAHKSSGSDVNDKPFLRFMDNATCHVELKKRTDGKIAAYRGDGTLLAVGTATLGATMRYIEAKVTINNTTGRVIVKVDGATDIDTGGGGVDTQNGGNAYVTSIVLGTGDATSLTSFSMWFDDLVIADTAGSVNNDFLGDVRVEAIYATGTGNSAQFTPSAGANWENVDDNPPDDDVTYNKSSTAGHKDTFAFGNLSSSTGTVLAVCPTLRMRKEDAGARQMRAVCRLAAVETESADIAPQTQYDFYQSVFETKPGGGAWTPTDVDGAEFGYKIQS